MTYQICEWNSDLGCQVSRDATPEETAQIDALNVAALVPVVPQEVPARGLRVALYKAGDLPAVESWVTGTAGEAADMIRIDWAAAATVQRDSALASGIQETLGKTDAEMDEIFIEADALGGDARRMV